MIYAYQKDHSFAGLSSDEIAKLMLVKSKNADLDFDMNLNALLEVASKVNPFHLISVLVQYALTEGITDTGERPGKGVEVQQSHIELLQAIYLKILTDSTVNLSPSHPDQTKAIIDVLPKLGEAFIFSFRYEAWRARTARGVKLSSN
jgi:hypothetical protein